MKANINKTWLHTLQFFTKLFAQSRHTETTVQQTAVLTVWHTSTTSQPIAALYPPPVISPTVTSTLRASRNHVWQRGSMLQRNAPLLQTNQTQ